MNNYLGIGIDAKVALEFHHMRDSYPSLFTSQVNSYVLHRWPTLKRSAAWAGYGISLYRMVHCWRLVPLALHQPGVLTCGGGERGEEGEWGKRRLFSGDERERGRGSIPRGGGGGKERRRSGWG
jgi:hypothetical protein